MLLTLIVSLLQATLQATPQVSRMTDEDGFDARLALLLHPSKQRITGYLCVNKFMESEQQDRNKTLEGKWDVNFVEEASNLAGENVNRPCCVLKYVVPKSKGTNSSQCNDWEKIKIVTE